MCAWWNGWMEMEWGEGGRGTTEGGGALEGPRSMAAAILSRLEEMRPRGRSNIAIRSRRPFTLCRIPDSSRSSISNPVCWSCRKGWSSGLAMLPRRVVGSGPWWLRCSLLRWPVRTAREARVFLRSCYIVFLYCVAALNVFHVNND